MNCKDEFEAWQQEWRTTVEDSPADHPMPLPEKRRKTPREMLYLLAIAIVFLIGLALRANAPPTDAKHSLYILAVIFSLAALWVGGSKSGPDPVSEKPEQYLKLRERIKARELTRTNIAQCVAIMGFILSLVTLWFALKATPNVSSLEDQLAPAAVLLVAMFTMGGLGVVRGRRKKELTYLQELERQFDETARTPDDPQEPTKSVSSTELRSLLRLLRQFSPSPPNRGSANSPKRKRRERRIHP